MLNKRKIIVIVLLCFVCAIVAACGGANNSDSKDHDPAPEGVTPAVYIDVDGKQDITSKEEYLPATVTLKDGDGAVALDGVSAKVRGRGNYTWTLPKKGYRIKFDKKQQMLSAYKCKSWALLPNYTDKTLLRNYYAMQVARGMDGLDWATDAKLIEVYVNGTYLGVYLLCDQTQVDENRVDVEEGSLDADTGFLVERDSYALTDAELVEGRDYFTISEDVFVSPDASLNGKPIPYVLKSPEYPDRGDYDTDAEFDIAAEAYAAQFEFIKDYITSAFRAAIRADYTEFSRLCDTDSFADYFILDQVSSNYEIDRFSSFYFHKDKGGALIAGPVWDFDMAAGYYNVNPAHEFRYVNNWFIGLGQNSVEFRKLYADRVEKHSQLFKREAQKLADVANAHRAAIERNNKKWPISEYVSPMPPEIAALNTYKKQLDFFTDFITRRIDYVVDFTAEWRR